jgi:hypothetical protein
MRVRGEANNECRRLSLLSQHLVPYFRFILPVFGSGFDFGKLCFGSGSGLDPEPDPDHIFQLKKKRNYTKFRLSNVRKSIVCFPESCHLIFDFLTVVFHFLLDPDPYPYPERIPVSLKQKRFLQFRFHNTVFIVPSTFRCAETKKDFMRRTVL